MMNCVLNITLGINYISQLFSLPSVTIQTEVLHGSLCFDFPPKTGGVPFVLLIQATI